MSPVQKIPAGLHKGLAAAAPAAVPVEQRSQPATVSAEHRPRPEKPVRFTLDLDREHHQFLKDYAVQVEARGAAEVMRALLDELRTDPELASRVRARIWQQG